MAQLSRWQFLSLSIRCLLYFSCIEWGGKSHKWGSSPKSSVLVWKTVVKVVYPTLLKIDRIAIYSNKISKFTECEQSCLLIPYKCLLWIENGAIAILCAFDPYRVSYSLMSGESVSLGVFRAASLARILVCQCLFHRSVYHRNLKQSYGCVFML